MEDCVETLFCKLCVILLIVILPSHVRTINTYMFDLHSGSKGISCTSGYLVQHVGETTPLPEPTASTDTPFA